MSKAIVKVTPVKKYGFVIEGVVKAKSIEAAKSEILECSRGSLGLYDMDFPGAWRIVKIHVMFP